MIQPCKDCSVSYEITEGEVEFYQAKGFPIPKRCEDCRKKKRAQYPNDNIPFKGKLNKFNEDRPRRTY